MDYSRIPQFTRDGGYVVDKSWGELLDWLDRRASEFNTDPDFQRPHVWSETQQRSYIEFCLKGGKGSNEFKFNYPGWMKDFDGPGELVDGKQRLLAIRKFMTDQLRVFGRLRHEFTGVLRPTVRVMINDLKTRKEVLQWYLELNSGGTPHTTDELERVRNLLFQEQKIS